MEFAWRLRLWRVSVGVGEVMKKLRAYAKRMRFWFISEDKVMNRRFAYSFLILIPFGLVLLSFELTYGRLDEPLFIAILIAILLDIVFLVMLFITHFIVFRVNLAKQKKRGERQQAEAPAEDDEEHAE